jgi:hypothetical protein
MIGRVRLRGQTVHPLIASIAGLLLFGLFDTYATPMPVVIVSENHRFYARAVPDPDTDRRSPKGVVNVFEVRADADALLWQSRDCYPGPGLLCNDGHHAVSGSDTGLSIYTDGQLTRALSADEFGENPAGGWPPPSFGFVDEAELVRMTSFDGTERVVDVRTGEIVATHEGVLVQPEPWRSLLRPPRRSAWQRVVDAWPVLLGGALVGLLIGLRVGYVRWRRQQHLAGP